MKSFFPKTCPACGEPLSIVYGDKEETIKLICKNKNCIGSKLKRLQIGIIALEIRGFGPKVIEKLMYAGINSTIELFNPEIFNEKNLINSGYFKKGRALEKILNSIENVKSIPIQNFILSLQLNDVGETASKKIALLMSGLNSDFTGLPYSIRDNMNEIIENISEKIKIIENQTKIKIVKIIPVKKISKKVLKLVAIEENNLEIIETIKKLNWEIVDLNTENCNMLIVENDKFNTTQIKTAKELGLKIMSIKKIKLLFL
jgi:NAD-dependent DNA ligase